MITVHHLENSRSERILWLLEELGIDYAVERYARDPETMRAPASMRAVHPLGKSPIVVDGDEVLAESGAIVDYLVRRYGKGRLAPAPEDPDFARYLHFLHFAEGSAMFQLVLDLFSSGELVPGGEPTPLAPAVREEVCSMLRHLETELEDRAYFAGEHFSAADVMMTFPLGVARSRGLLEELPKLAAYLERIEARDAHRRAARKAAA